MAQKKVILKDGSDDLLPKTLASMVFTEAGQTVEEALQNAGGGSSSGGGTGNVKVTNASGLNEDNYYAFKPSANGSVEGRFVTLPYANDRQGGLMGSNDKTKLDDIKALSKFPLAVASLTNNSTSEEILQAIGAESSQAHALLYIMLSFSNAEVNEYNPDYPQVFIGNTPANMRCTYDSEAVSGTMELTYVAAGDKLRTITISGKQGGTSPDYTYTYSCSITESGDDTYYLLPDILYLKSGATQAEIDTAFGGEGKFGKALVAASSKKKLYIYNSVLGLIPVATSLFSSASGTLSFVYHDNLDNITYIKYIKKREVHIIYPSGYSLSPSLYSLYSSSSSDDISAAVGGESGLKKIIQAVKDGNRLVIRGNLSGMETFTADTTVKSVLYQEGENGDIVLVFAFDIYFIMGYSTFYKTIQYTKSSNTFSCSSGETNMVS